MAKPMVSIVICTYNRCQSLQDTLRALARQAVREGLRLEVVVVDNNSRDETKTVAGQGASLMPWAVRYIFEGKQGLSCARNAGIRAAQGEVIAFIDDDVIPDPHWAQGLWDCFEQTRCDAVAGRVDALWICSRPAWLGAELHGPLISQDLGSQRLRWTFTNRFMLGANMAFRRELFASVGFFKEELGRRGSSLIGGEDRDICERLLAAGKVLMYEPSAMVQHKVEPDRVTPEYYRRWFHDIGRTVGHQMPVRWYHRVLIAPAWEWKDAAKALGRCVHTRLHPAANDADRFAGELWLRFHRAVLRERLDHWLGKDCHFVKA